MLHHDGSDELVTVSDDGALGQWALGAGHPRKVAEAVLEDRPERITAVHVTTRPGRTPIVQIGHQGGLVGVWALNGSIITASRRVSDADVTCLARDGERVLAGTRTGTLVTGPDEERVIRTAHRSAVQALMPVRARQSRRVILGCADGWLTVVNLTDPDQAHLSIDLDAPVNDLLLLPGGQDLAVATDRGVVILALPWS